MNPETFISNGDAAPVIFDAKVYPTWRWANLDIASTGRLIYTAESENSGAGATRNLVFLDDLGVENDFESEPAFYLLPSIDPSGERLAVTVIDPNGLRDIWVFDRSAKTFGRRSFSGDSVRSVWSFDGQQLIFSCGDKSLCVTNADGTSDQSEIFSGLSQPVPLAHTRNGALLLTQGTPRNVYKTNLGESISDLQSETILTDLNLAPADNSDAVVSSDENWIAYSSNETGRFEIYVRPFTDISSGKWQVSRQGGRYPRWDSKRNKLLWWDTKENAIMASTFNVAEASNRRIISFENPSFEFDADYVLSQISRSWDFYPETGEAFFIKDMMTEDVIANQIQFHITEDFFSELNATAPAFPE
ncbi:MAG: hypothetical protein VX166_01520 [Pseudomonadota bacterium]|nr:hypothetical protein [Pseudomonadota bacterium]